MDAEEQLRDRVAQGEARLAAYEAIARVLSESSTLEDAICGTMEAIGDHLGWTRAFFWEPDANDVLHVTQHRSASERDAFDDASRDASFVRGAGLPGRVWQTGQPAFIEKLSSDDNFARLDAARACGFASAFAFPLRIDRTLLGVLEFFKPTPTPVDTALLELMGSVGRHLAHVVARLRAQDANAAVLSVALDAIVSIDHRGRIVEWNPAAERMFGIARVAAIGREMAEVFVPPTLREAHRAGLARYLRTGEARVLGRRIEIVAMRADGTEFPVELAITRVGKIGPAMFTGFIRDVTKEVTAAREREDLLRREQGARAAAESDRAELARANRIKDEFLATVSHELRTPLQAILGWASMLRGAPAAAITQRAVAVIERNALAQARLIADVLDVSRIASGVFAIRNDPVDIAKIIEMSLEALRPTAAAKNLTLTCDVESSLPAVRGDFDRLQQVVSNLVANALKFTPSGGRIEVRAAAIGDAIEIVVSDDGEGIVPEFLPFVFDRFRQGDARPTRRHGGLGLGLAIVHHLVQVHGGTVRAESDGPGKGARFTVTLPAAPPPSDAPATAERTAIVRSLDGVSVLVVEDDDDAREMFAAAIASAGGDVSIATDATQALSTRGTKEVDIVVTDLGMPEIDGYELLSRWRETGSRIPFVAVTAFASADDGRRALDAGFDAFVAKPVSADELVSRVEAVLAAERARVLKPRA